MVCLLLLYTIIISRLYRLDLEKMPAIFYGAGHTGMIGRVGNQGSECLKNGTNLYVFVAFCQEFKYNSI